MENPKEIKRMNYLSFFKDGATDSLLYKKQDPNKLFSAYYKQCYDFGLEVRSEQQWQELGDEFREYCENIERKKNGR